MLVYDLEIIKPPSTGFRNIDPTISKYEFAKDWKDFENMGIAVMVWYNYNDNKYKYITSVSQSVDLDIEQLYIRTKLEAVEEFAKSNLTVGFNILNFDNPIMRVNNFIIDDGRCYDILKQLWFAVGLDSNYDPKTHGGYNLNAVAKSNMDIQKTMSGKDAPFKWQDGEYIDVIKYCKQDVEITKNLMDKIFTNGGVIDPKTKKFIRMAIPQ